MDFKSLDLKLSYRSIGEENIAKSFLVPALKRAKTYRRSVGYFSSSVFSTIFDGIVALSQNGGKIEIIASPQLSENDIEAINIGYQKREELIEGFFSRDFLKELENLDNSTLMLLSELIANGVLDIKIALTDSIGIYHDKLGILEDFNGNIIVFFGSANETESGYKNNYEKIRVMKNWDIANNGNIIDECNEFQSLWDGENPHVKTFDYKKSAELNIIQVIDKRKQSSNNLTSEPIRLFTYQNDAIQAWCNNGYKGFYVMATGTGKTWTAIYSAKKLVESNPSMIVICAPYKHLVKQWADDIKKTFPTAKVILVFSENPQWEQQITTEIIKKEYTENLQIIVITTLASFRMERFISTIKKSKEDKLLIVDEAHRLTNRPDYIKKMFKYLLGLSATPYSGISAQKGNELVNWFGGRVFNLPIEIALERGFLVKYNYYPIFINTTEEDEKKFNSFTQKILSCFKNNICINPDLLVTSIRNRLRTISMASEKAERIEEIIGRIKEDNHFIVYCGDGKLFDEDQNREIRHIHSILKVLSKLDYKASQFTARENMDERMSRIDAFNKGEISALAAIRCLDEGINIPSIKSALILSSNDDFREFVQRRGRILRKHDGKTHANIYDVIVLPSSNLQSWAKIEFRRFYEYARIALNWDELLPQLNNYLEIYGLNINDINVYDFNDVEEMIDE